MPPLHGRSGKRAAYPPSLFLAPGPASPSSAPDWRGSIDCGRQDRQANQQGQPVPRVLWTRSEVALQLGVSQSHIANLVRAKQLLPTYVGTRKQMFSNSAIEAFLAAGAAPREMNYEGPQEGRERLETPDHTPG